jgi:putative aldouronate transport system permease protein
MLLLPVTYFIVFCYFPIGGSLVAFKDYNIFEGMWASEWVGLRHFREAFQSVEFLYALRNTLFLNAGDMILGFPMPILLAVGLNEMHSSIMKKTTQVITYLPHFLSMVIVSGIVYQVFSYTGIINTFLFSLGITPLNFLGEPIGWMFVYWITGIWKSAGYGMIIYLAALTAIDPTLNEAACIDGANRIQRILNVTLPMIRPTIVVLLILNIGSVVTISFDRPYLMANVLVKDVANVISTHVYTVGLKSGRFDFAAAIGLFQSLVGVIMITGANLVSRKLGEEGIL